MNSPAATSDAASGFEAVIREPQPHSVTATNALFRDYAGLLALIVRRVGDPDLAADILQDAAVTTLHKLRSGEIARPELASGYIYRVALNHLRNHRRKDKSAISRSDGLDDIADPSIEKAAETMRKQQWSAIVAKVLSGLPMARDRELLVRFYLDDEDKDSICHSLKLTETHFHRVIFRARVRFRALLQHKGYAKHDLLSIAVLFAGLVTVALQSRVSE